MSVPWQPSSFQPASREAAAAESPHENPHQSRQPTLSPRPRPDHRLDLLAAIMIATLVMLISLARIDRKNKIESSRQLVVAQKQLAVVMKDQAEIDRELRKPQNAAVLERSVLLNEMLLAKGISWTRIFSDLEKALPANVRIIQIHPQVDAQNKIFLQMVVGADNTIAARCLCPEAGSLRRFRRDHGLQHRATFADRPPLPLHREREICTETLT